MSISRDFIDGLLDRIDIVDIIDSRVSLRKKGANHMACCPFHQEKTPSFSVSQSKQFYYCFGCGAHGDALGFLMAYERLEFAEAVEELARGVGLEVPVTYDAPGKAIAAKKSSSLYQLLAKVQRFYQWQLKHNPIAVDYLKARAVSGDIAKDYALGFAPDAWDAAIKQFGGSSEAMQSLYQAGLTVKNDQGRGYDRFRNRIMFPIRDMRGRTIGFGGRVLDRDGEPKYLNSPETTTFHKSESLYGLFEAKKRRSKFERLLVVEGYMDVIALAQHGVDYAVATLGTAVTVEHVRRLLKQTPSLIFCFDGDKAGLEAAWRSVKVSLAFMSGQNQVGFLFLPQGEDPDSIIRKEGREEFEQRIKQATPLSEFMWQQLCLQVDLSHLEGRAQLVQLAKPYLQLVPEGPYADLLSQALAKLTKLDAAQVDYRLKQNIKKDNVEQISTRRILTPVEKAVALLAQNPNLAKLIDYKQIETSDEYAVLFNQMIAAIRIYQPNNTGKLLSLLSDNEHAQKIAQLAFAYKPIISDKLKQEFIDLLKKISEEKNSQLIDKLIEKYERQGLSLDEKKKISHLLQQNKK